MNYFSTVSGIAFGLFFCATIFADSGPEQPTALGEIRGYKLPGTRNIRDLEPKVDLKRLEADLKDKSPNERDRLLKDKLIRQSDVLQIFQILKRSPKPVGPTFVVEGTGKTALENALKRFSKGLAPTRLPSDTDLSLVWFSQPCGHYIRLVAVEQAPRAFTLKYRFVLHQKAVMTPCLALVPIGKFAKGTYQVNVEQLPPLDELGGEIDKRPVCPVSGPFAFEVGTD